MWYLNVDISPIHWVHVCLLRNSVPGGLEILVGDVGPLSDIGQFKLLDSAIATLSHNLGFPGRNHDTIVEGAG